MHADVLVEITYNHKNSTTVIRINAKKEAVEEFLEAFLATQAGAGPDNRKRNDENPYVILLGLEMKDDTFHILKNNTGNDGLICGIVIDTVNKIKNIPILPFV